MARPFLADPRFLAKAAVGHADRINTCIACNQACLEVDTVVVCAGQEPQRDLYEGLQGAGVPVALVGGAHVAVELGAVRAIREATEVAAAL